jgi:PilZ domain-containing protein
MSEKREKPDAKTRQRERSRAVRISAEHPRVPGTVTFVAGAISGSGTIFDISATGAHVYRPTKDLAKGAVADLFFLQPETGRKLHAVGQVVRHTDSGFAVRFLRIERELEALVLGAADDAPDELETEESESEG